MIEIRTLAAAGLLAISCAPLAPAAAQQVAMQQPSGTVRVVPEPPRRQAVAEDAIPQEAPPARPPIYVLLGVGF